MRPWKPLALSLCVGATACGLIAGIEDVPDAGSTTGPGGPDASQGNHHDATGPGNDATMPGVDAHGHDAVSHEAATHEGGTSTPDVAKADAGGAKDASSTMHEAGFDAPSGYIRCGNTLNACDGDGGECCVAVYGQYAGDANTFNDISTDCQGLGSPNCGSYGNVGNVFNMQFVQTCSSPAECPSGESCCVTFPGTMPDPTAVTGIGCASGCSGLAICRTDIDCMSGHSCVAETDPVLSHIFSRYCD